MTSIEWTDVTWNPVRGCSRVSEGCRNCYAEGVARRFSGPGMPYEGLIALSPKVRTVSRPALHGSINEVSHVGRWNGTTRFVPEVLAAPLSWRKPRRVFVNSMSDLFHESLSNEDIAAVFGVMAACPKHTFQVLTKRPERARSWFAWISTQTDYRDRWIGSVAEAELLCREPIGSRGADQCSVERVATLRIAAARVGHRPHLPFYSNQAWPLPNVWLGISVEDQKSADERIPVLLASPAAVRFVSYEPALAPVDFDRPRCDIHGRDEVASGPEGEFCNECAANGYADELSFGHWLDPLNGGLDWVIVGGESGPGARPFDLAWARSTVEQCREAGVPVFVKQLGARPCSSTLEDVPVPRVATSEWADVHGIGERWTFRFAHGKGGDVEEWPEDLRVREFPEVLRG